MAALFGNFDIWSLSSDESFEEVYKQLGDEFLTMSWVTGLLAGLICPVATVGNGLVLAAILLDPLKKIRKAPSNYIILSLALSDFLLGSLMGPVFALWFIYFAVHRVPLFSITINLAVGYVLACTSVFSLVVLTVDRRIAVATPLQYPSKVTKRRVLAANLFIWCYFIIFGVIVAILKKGIYINAMIIVGHISLAYCAIVFHNITIVLSMRRQTNTMKQLSHSENVVTLRQAQEKEKKLARTVLILISVFSLLFLPFAVTQVLSYICVPCKGNVTLLTWLFMITCGVFFANTIVNPFLYALFLPKYKESFAYLVKSCRFPPVRVQAVEVTPLSAQKFNKRTSFSNTRQRTKRSVVCANSTGN